VPAPLLVVVAYPPELRAIPATLRRAPGVAVAAVGVGPVAAASGTAALLDRVRPRAVVLVGTAGAYPDAGIGCGTACCVRSARLADGAATMGLGAIPRSSARPIRSNARLLRILGAAGATAADVATLVAITTDDRLAARLGRIAAVEHMETFAVAAACRSARVPFAAILGVANVVGRRGRAQWKSGEAAALRSVRAVLGRAAISLLRTAG